jgi:hypothetical protein
VPRPSVPLPPLARLLVLPLGVASWGNNPPATTGIRGFHVRPASASREIDGVQRVVLFAAERARDGRMLLVAGRMYRTLPWSGLS